MKKYLDLWRAAFINNLIDERYKKNLVKKIFSKLIMNLQIMQYRRTQKNLAANFYKSKLIKI